MGRYQSNAFIQALYSDNPHTAEEYGRQLEEISDCALKQRLKEGNWDYDEEAGTHAARQHARHHQHHRPGRQHRGRMASCRRYTGPGAPSADLPVQQAAKVELIHDLRRTFGTTLAET